MNVFFLLISVISIIFSSCSAYLSDVVEETEYCTVSFDSNGGSPVMQQRIAVGKNARTPVSPTKDGFVFDFWTKSDSSEKYDFSKSVENDITLLANWSVVSSDEVVVSFYSGDDLYEQQKVKIGESAKEPSRPTKEGKAFGGWYCDAEFESKFDFSTKISEKISLYALWIDPVGLYVNAGGNNANAGTQASPLATLQGAFEKIKTLSAELEDGVENAYSIHIVDEITGNGTGDYVSNSGCYAVAESDIKAAEIQIIGESGGKITCTDAESSIKIETSAPFVLKNITISNNAKGSIICVSGGADVTLESGTVLTGNEAKSDHTGAGVYVENGGKLTMKDGSKITNNTAQSGGGVQNLGTFVMEGGEISENEAAGEGGGVYNAGTMFMCGSAVIGDSSKTTVATNSARSNIASGKGGGIFVAESGKLYIGYKSETSADSSFSGGIFYNFASFQGGAIYSASSNEIKIASGTIGYNGSGKECGGIRLAGLGKAVMSGGTLVKNIGCNSGNTEPFGNMVHIGGGSSFELSGGVIKDCETNNGSAVFVNTGATFKMSGGTISGNKSTGSLGNGGGVYNKGTFEFIKGTISENKSAWGAGVYNENYATFTMSGGSISGNTATYFSGAVYNSGSFTMSGGSISENTTNDSYPGVYQGGSFEMSGSAEISSDNPIVLGTGKTISLQGTLSKTNAATVQLKQSEDYAEGTNVLTGGTTSENHTKFEIYDLHWEIDEEGKLKRKTELVFDSSKYSRIADFAKKIKNTVQDGDTVTIKIGNDISSETDLSELISAFDNKNCSATIDLTECTSLTLITSIFNSKQWLSAIKLPSSVTLIEQSAFDNCNNLKSVTFPPDSKLETIGPSAFHQCTSLESISLPASLAEIADNAFQNCSNLSSLTFAENCALATIGQSAFQSTKITSVEFPGELKTINAFAFHGSELASAVFSGGGTWKISQNSNVKVASYNVNESPSNNADALKNADGDSYADCLWTKN